MTISRVEWRGDEGTTTFDYDDETNTLRVNGIVCGQTGLRYLQSVIRSLDLENEKKKHEELINEIKRILDGNI